MSEPTAHEHGNCELCDQLERDHARALDEIERLTAIITERIDRDYTEAVAIVVEYEQHKAALAARRKETS